MRHLIDMGFDEKLREFADKKKSVLGICLGMQLCYQKVMRMGHMMALI